MKKFLKKILLGITFPKEYLCLDINEFKKPLRVFVKDLKSTFVTEITEYHLFIGYKPLLFAVDKKYLNNKDVNSFQQLAISFRTANGNEIASIVIKLVKELKVNSTSCLVYEGIKGVNSLANPFHKITGSIYYYLTSDKKQNIFLAGNLYNQVKIAYSVPRKIYLVSVGSSGLFNIFPTDLSGEFQSEYFIMSLRSGGKANQQIINEGNCLISVMEADSFIEVYSAGKNHMKELSEKENFEIRLNDERSAQLKLPVPIGAIKYYEVKKIDQVEIGIHTIHFFRIMKSVKITDKKSTLAHIHRDYAEWRKRNGINTNYLIENKKLVIKQIL